MSLYGAPRPLRKEMRMELPLSTLHTLQVAAKESLSTARFEGMSETWINDLVDAKEDLDRAIAQQIRK